MKNNKKFQSYIKFDVQPKLELSMQFMKVINLYWIHLIFLKMKLTKIIISEKKKESNNFNNKIYNKIVMKQKKVFMKRYALFDFIH